MRTFSVGLVGFPPASFKWPFDFPFEKLLEQIDECCEGMEYCSVCDDWFPGDRTCRHLHWSDEIGMTVGCGTNEISPEDHKASFFALLDRSVADRWNTLEARLMGRQEVCQSCRGTGKPCNPDLKDQICFWCNGTGRVGPRRLHDDSHLWDDPQDATEVGRYWLRSLEPCVTVEAIALTLAWIEEWRHMSHDGRCYWRMETEPQSSRMSNWLCWAKRRMRDPKPCLADELDLVTMSDHLTKLQESLIASVLIYLAWDKRKPLFLPNVQ